MTKTSITIIPVSFIDGKAQKYQAQVTFCNDSKAKPLHRTISGDPKRSKADALEALQEELKNWTKRISGARAVIHEYEENNK